MLARYLTTSEKMLVNLVSAKYDTDSFFDCFALVNNLTKHYVLLML